MARLHKGGRPRKDGEREANGRIERVEQRDEGTDEIRWRKKSETLATDRELTPMGILSGRHLIDEREYRAGERLKRVHFGVFGYIDPRGCLWRYQPVTPPDEPERRRGIHMREPPEMTDEERAELAAEDYAALHKALRDVHAVAPILATQLAVYEEWGRFGWIGRQIHSLNVRREPDEYAQGELVSAMSGAVIPDNLRLGLGLISRCFTAIENTPLPSSRLRSL